MNVVGVLPLIVFVFQLLLANDPYPYLPPLSDRYRYPPLAHCTTCRQFAGDHVRFIEAYLPNQRHRECELLVALEAARWHYAVWDKIEDAAGYPGKTEWERREALRLLRDKLLGPSAYQQGWMPPPAPIRHFLLID